MQRKAKPIFTRRRQCIAAAFLAGANAMPAAAQTDDLNSILGSGGDAPAPAAAPNAAAPAPAAAAPAAPAPGTSSNGAAPDATAEAPEHARSPGKNRLVEEIVVTAQKREENLQDVPISVQAFSAGQLDAKGIEEPKALVLTTPGLSYNILAGYSLIYIRGVGTDAFIPSADASVATYIDGIYYPFGHGLASALGSVERIEVLKGPQGTLFGRNSTGGAINIITKQPGDEFKVSGQVEHENYNKTNYRLFANLPITSKIAVSVSGLDYGSDSYYKPAPTSGEPGTIPRDDSRAYNIKLGITPIEDLKVVLGYTYLNTRGADSMMFPAEDIKPLGKLLGVAPSPDYVFGGNAPVYENDTSRVMTADIKYHMNWLDTRVLLGNQIIGAPSLVDFDGSNKPLVGFEAVGQFARVRTAELQLISNDSSPSWLKWLGGVYYINSSAGYNPLHLFVGQGLVTYLEKPTGLLAGLTSPLIGALEQVPVVGGLLNQLDQGVVLSLRGILDTKSLAGYFQTTADMTDWASFTLGGRYQVETRRLAKSTTSLILNSENVDPSQEIPVFDFGTQTANTANFSPKAVLDFKLSDTQHTYVSFGKGFKSGTFNIIDVYEATQYIPPESTTAYELGYKASYFDGAVRFNAALFQNQIKNLQVQNISLTSGGAARFETAGSARIQGADFDLTWQMLPETLPGLVLTGGGAYLRGRYTDYKDGAGYDETTGLFFGGQGLLINGGILPGRNFTGNTLVRTPTFSGNTTLSYAFDVGEGQVETSVDYYYNTGFYFSAQNDQTARQPKYDVMGARASYFYEPWGMRLTLYGKNILSEKYYYGVEEFDFDTAKLLAPPAQYGVRLNWDF